MLILFQCFYINYRKSKLHISKIKFININILSSCALQWQLFQGLYTCGTTITGYCLNKVTSDEFQVAKGSHYFMSSLYSRVLCSNCKEGLPCSLALLKAVVSL